MCRIDKLLNWIKEGTIFAGVTCRYSYVQHTWERMITDDILLALPHSQCNYITISRTKYFNGKTTCYGN